MELISQFSLNPLRVYTIPKRVKNKKGIATFPAKHTASYLDYSVDFSNQLSDKENIIRGKVVCNHKVLQINLSFFKENYLTAFLSGGEADLSFYLTFIVNTNKGNELIQDIILPTYGYLPNKNIDKKHSFLFFTEKIKPLNTRPPLNALAINGYYFINNINSYIMV